MGCGESKIKEISLTPEIHMNDSKIRVYDTPKPTAIIAPTFDETTILPNRLLAAIPVSDLGDSLDSRHLSESLNLSHGFGMRLDSSDKDGLGQNSDDSGYDEYDEEYSHIITEHSAPELVEKVEREFKPVKLKTPPVKILDDFQKISGLLFGCRIFGEYFHLLILFIS